ncbi:MFS multidrug transporter [Thozetella sp. PMI_491]|nr:MFS multidrug transporter [Thozetella sp. PMI_491]
MSSSTAGAEETTPLLGAPVPGSASQPSVSDGEEGSRQPPQASSGTQDGVTKSSPNMWLIFPAISIGIFLSAADQTIALVSYATISSELDALNLASWIMTAYSLTVASVQPLYGKLCDIFGRKQCLLMGYAVFAVGCLGCALAQSMGQLILARVLQAAGGGGLGTVISVLLTGLVPPEDRGVWQGIVNIVYALGAGLGAPLGGLLAGSVGWRWAFLGQVPICVMAFLAATWVLDGDAVRADEPAQQGETLLVKLRRVDFLGSGTLIVSIASLMLGLDRASNISWTSLEAWGAFLLSGLTAAAFLYIEGRVAKEPIVPLSTAFSPELFPIYSASFLCFFAIIALEYELPLYYQARDGMGPEQASLYMLPAIFAGVISAMMTGFWMKRTGQYYWALLLSFTLQSLGGLIAVLLSGPIVKLTPGLVAAQVVSEFGVGNVVVSGLLAVIANGSNHSIAVVTAAYYSIRNLGSVIGVSVVSTVIQMYLRSFLVTALEPFDLDVDEIVTEVRKSLESVNDLNPEIAYIVRECYGWAMSRGFMVIFAVALCTLIPASQIRGGKTRRANGKKEDIEENMIISVGQEVADP